MSCRDPMEERAEIILCNLHFWWAEIRLMEPRVVGRPVDDLLDDTLRPPAQGGAVSNPTEAFGLRRLTWLRPLSRLRGVIYRLPPHLKKVYWLRYREGLTRGEISGAAHIAIPTVDKRLSVIRGRVAGCLSRMKPDEKAALRELISYLTRGRRPDPDLAPSKKMKARKK